MSDYPQLNDPKIQDRLKRSMIDISGLYTIGEANRETISESLKELAKELDVPAKLIRKMARTYHKQNFQTEIQETETFQDAYEKVFGS